MFEFGLLCILIYLFIYLFILQNHHGCILCTVVSTMQTSSLFHNSGEYLAVLHSASPLCYSHRVTYENS